MTAFMRFCRRVFALDHLVFTFVLGVILFVLLSIFSVTCVSGTSMEPTLEDGQFLVCLRQSWLSPVSISRGDIVIVYMKEEDTYIIKRVIGVPGDQLESANGQVYINGAPYDEPYIKEPMVDTLYRTIPKQTIPENHFFILGDNRNNSFDSRIFGCVEQSQIHAVVSLKYQILLTAALIGSLVLLFWLPQCCSDWVFDWLTADDPEDEAGKICA